jgi:CheY-like chemotaxis protein
MTTALIIDTDVANRDLVASLLTERTDLVPTIASSGHNALKMIHGNRPDVVITHLDMADMNGLDFLTLCREAHPDLPVILMTAHGSEDVAAEALRRGAASYVPKRHLKRDLVRAVNEVVSMIGPFRRKRSLLERIERTEEQFTLCGNIQDIHTLVMRVQECLIPMGLCDEAGRMQVGVALEEALLNAHYHGNLEISSDLRDDDDAAFYTLAEERMTESHFGERRIFVTITLTAERGCFVIRDEGAGFNPALQPDPTDATNLEKAGGRGLLLIRTFMDEVTFNDAGNEITLIKHGSKTT